MVKVALSVWVSRFSSELAPKIGRKMGSLEKHETEIHAEDQQW